VPAEELRDLFLGYAVNGARTSMLRNRFIIDAIMDDYKLY